MGRILWNGSGAEERGDGRIRGEEKRGRARRDESGKRRGDEENEPRGEEMRGVVVKGKERRSKEIKEDGAGERERLG